jgi:hypothetical protein
MGVEIRNIPDPAVEAEIFDTLAEAGFEPSMRGDVIVLSGVGHQGGDRSVDLEIDLLEMDSFRILQFRSLLRTQPSDFDTASLACTRGNSATTIPKFDVIERTADATNPHRFGIQASFHLFADSLPREELRVMLMLYLKELDDIDNELAEIVLLR